MYDDDEELNDLTGGGAVTTDERPVSAPAPSPPAAPAVPATGRTPALIQQELDGLYAKMLISSSPADRARVEALSRELYLLADPGPKQLSPEDAQAALHEEGDGSPPTVDRLLALLPRAPRDGWNVPEVHRLAGAMARLEPDPQLAAGDLFGLLPLLAIPSSSDVPEADATDAELRLLWGPKHGENLALVQEALVVAYPSPAERQRVIEFLEDPASGRLGDNAQVIVRVFEIMQRRQKRKTQSAA